MLSSLSEGSPNALLEAMAAGVPVVATRVGGIPEIVCHGETALLVEPGDIAGMSSSIATVLQDLAARPAPGRSRQGTDSRASRSGSAGAQAVWTSMLVYSRLAYSESAWAVDRIKGY